LLSSERASGQNLMPLNGDYIVMLVQPLDLGQIVNGHLFFRAAVLESAVFAHFAGIS